MLSNGSTISSTSPGSHLNLSSSTSVSKPHHDLFMILVLTSTVPVVVLETKNRTLEETAAIFDGEDVVERIAAAAHGVATGANDKDEKSSESFHEEVAKV